jgi:hypothetical protein
MPTPRRGMVQRAECLMVVVVDVGEVAQLGTGQLWTGRIGTFHPSRSATGVPFTAGRGR